MIIGKLVQGRSHLDYVVQIYGPGEIEVTPQPEDYALGSFVRVAQPGGAADHRSDPGLSRGAGSL